MIEFAFDPIFKKLMVRQCIDVGSRGDVGNSSHSLFRGVRLATCQWPYVACEPVIKEPRRVCRKAGHSLVIVLPGSSL